MRAFDGVGQFAGIVFLARVMDSALNGDGEAFRFGDLCNGIGQFDHRIGFLSKMIDHAVDAACRRPVPQPGQRAHRILECHQAGALMSGSVDCQRLADQALNHEAVGDRTEALVIVDAREQFGVFADVFGAAAEDGRLHDVGDLQTPFAACD